MRGRLLVRLAAGQERDARHRGRHAILEHVDGFLRHLLDRSPFGGFLARYHHVRLEHGALELHVRVIEFLVHGLEHPFGDPIAAIRVVAAVHQHFRLYDGHDILLLAQCRIARERVRVGSDAGVGRDVLADVDDGAPFGKSRAEPAVFAEPLA